MGLSAVFVSGALTACNAPDPQEEIEDVQDEGNIAIAKPITPVYEAGEGEGGEGEGGVAISQAASDPVVYLSALAITEAHVIAARDAFVLGENEAAAEMFAHPVSEVLFDMEPVFKQLGVADFSPLLTETSAAIFAGEGPEQISMRTDTIVTALRKAAEKAPASEASTARIAAGVAVDQIGRAADMYRAAKDSDRYEPYLDGYGFYKAGETVFLRYAEDIAQENPSAASAIKDAIAKLEDAYPSAGRPTALDADLSALTVAASNAVLTVQD